MGIIFLLISFLVPSPQSPRYFQGRSIKERQRAEEKKYNFCPLPKSIIHIVPVLELDLKTT